MRFFRTYGSQLVFLLIGILIGFLLIHLPVEFEKEINLLDLTNIVITLILAVIIGFYIEPQNEMVRVEKDLLIEQLKTVKDVVKSLHDLFFETFNQDPLSVGNKQKFIGELKVLSNEVNLFLEQAEHCNNRGITRRKGEIQRFYYTFKRSITGGRFQQIDFKFSSIGMNRYEADFTKFKKEINNLIHDVNRRHI